MKHVDFTSKPRPRTSKTFTQPGLFSRKWLILLPGTVIAYSKLKPQPRSNPKEFFMRFAKTFFAAAASMLVAAAAHAGPVVNNNVRPVAIGSGPASEPTLQSALNTVFGAGNVSATTDQSTAGLWGAAAFPSSTIPTLVLEATGGATSQKFGIWFGNDTTNLLMVDLILGGATTASMFAPAAGLVMNSGGLQVTGPDCGVAINCTTVLDSRIDPTNFGFYFQTGSTIAYSVDSILGLNKARFLAYQGGTSTNWAFAYEDGSDYDYNDMVVKVESIKVPEPGSLALLGLGLAGLAAASRRKQKQA